MTFKDKLIFTLLSIVTIGIYPIVIFSKKPKAAATALSMAEKLTTDLSKLREMLGGNNNISGIEYTHTKVKVFIKEKNLINVEGIQNLKGVSGVFASSKFITIIVGNQAKKIATSL